MIFDNYVDKIISRPHWETGAVAEKLIVNE